MSREWLRAALILALWIGTVAFGALMTLAALVAERSDFSLLVGGLGLALVAYACLALGSFRRRA